MMHLTETSVKTNISPAFVTRRPPVNNRRTMGDSLLARIGNTPLLPFKTETIVGFEKAIWSYNEQLFVFESLPELKTELATYFDAL